MLNLLECSLFRTFSFFAQSVPLLGGGQLLRVWDVTLRQCPAMHRADWPARTSPPLLRPSPAVLLFFANETLVNLVWAPASCPLAALAFGVVKPALCLLCNLVLRLVVLPLAIPKDRLPRGMHREMPQNWHMRFPMSHAHLNLIWNKIGNSKTAQTFFEMSNLCLELLVSLHWKSRKQQSLGIYLTSNVWQFPGTQGCFRFPLRSLRRLLASAGGHAWPTVDHPSTKSCNGVPTKTWWHMPQQCTHSQVAAETATATA